MSVTRSGNGNVGTRPLAAPLLKLIWEERSISRAEIARRAGLSRSTVTEAVRDLLATGLVVESGIGETTGGRKPILLEFVDDAGCILGLDIGATHVAAALTNLRGQVMGWISRPHPVRDDPAGTRQLARECCDTLLANSVLPAEQLLGIGIGMPCPVNPARPHAISQVVMPAWQGASGLEPLGESYGRPLLVDNDANLAALAEHWWGAGRGVRDFAYIKIATGIGLGQILEGRVYRGAMGVAGEIGHLSVDPNGRDCVCGLKGCLATVAGAAAQVARAQELLEDYPQSSLTEFNLSSQMLESAAAAGDPLAERVVREAGELLGITIAGLLNLNNPALVLLGGGITQAGDALFDPIRDTVERRTLIGSLASTAIKPGELGEQAVAIGAATMILSAALEDPSIFPDWPGKGME